MQAHWAKYLCVLTAGFLENSIRYTLQGFATRTSSPKVANYVSSKLDRMPNPKAENLLQLIAAFDSAWAKDLEAFLSDDSRKESIDTIMSNRHLIAHGRH